MSFKSEMLSRQKYENMVVATKSLVDQTKLVFQEEMVWFDKYFGHNGEAFKIQSRIGKYFLAAVILGICVTLPLLMYGVVGLPKSNHSLPAAAVIGIGALIIVGSLLAGILTTFLVSRLFWINYQKQYIELKKFVINLFDNGLIDLSGFSQQILVLTKTEKILPPYLIRATNIPTDQLVNEYAKIKEQNHSQKLHHLLKTIDDVSALGRMGFFKPKWKYKLPEIFFFCGAIYYNCCSQVKKSNLNNVS